jgi:putative cell wall-binding protein
MESLGFQEVISAEVESQVAQITSIDEADIVRIGGEDRFETSLEVAKYFNFSGHNVCLATGNNFPDALTGSVYAANSNAPIILGDEKLSDRIMDYLKTRKSIGVTIFGGEAVISNAIEQEISQMLAK